MAHSFLEIAEILEQVVPLEQPGDNLILRKKYVIHFLYAIVFELCIKIIYEKEKGCEAPYNHDILCLYRKLSPASQEKISNFHNTQVSTAKELISLLNSQKNHSGQAPNLKVKLPKSLEESLEINKLTMRDFKYDGQLNEKSSILCSLMSTKDRIIALPPSTRYNIVFPKSLLEYAISLESLVS